MCHIVHIGGAKGVGKTTLLSEICKEGRCFDKSLSTIQMSGFLSNVAQQTYGLPWKEMDDDKRVSARNLAIETLRESTSDIILLDSHCIDMEGCKPKIIMPKEITEIIGSYIVLTAPVEEIRERRIKDQNVRERDLDPVNIQTEMDWEIRTAQELSKMTGLNATIIPNLEMETTIVAVRNHIESVFATRETRAEDLYAHRIHHHERF